MAMTEKQQLEFFDKKSRLYFKYGGICGAERCGKSLPYNGFQLGHRISQSEIDKYGPEIIHHEMNMVPVCGLSCNKRVDIGKKPGSIMVLLEQILEEIGRVEDMEIWKAELLKEIRDLEKLEQFDSYENRSGRRKIPGEENNSERGVSVLDIYGRTGEEFNGLFE